MPVLRQSQGEKIFNLAHACPACKAVQTVPILGVMPSLSPFPSLGLQRDECDQGACQGGGGQPAGAPAATRGLLQ